jgi:CheY-like chemotaxis protein
VSAEPHISTAQSGLILCIDDESAGLAVRKRVLESAGYRVETARSAQDGIRLFRSSDFDLVICDYWMRSMNGIAASREIRRINSSVPVIILSGFSQLPDESIGVADRWILKDEGPEFLLDAIHDLLKTRS